MLGFLIALAFAVFCGMLAEKCGYSYWLFFILGLFLGLPVFLALLIVYFVQRYKRNRQRKSARL